MKKYNLEALKVAIEQEFDLQSIEIIKNILIIKMNFVEPYIYFNENLNCVKYYNEYLDIFEFISLYKHEFEI